MRLISIGTGPEIKFTPPARLNCPMVAAVARWIGKRAQQRAAKQLGSRIVSVVNMSAYSCRNRNNSPTGRLSEHAFANALDVGAFKLADGKTVSVLRDWGPAERDLLAFAQRETAKEAERRRIAQERANRQRQAAARQTREASARSDPGRTPAAGANARSAAQRLVRRPRAESSTQGQALPARKAARAAQGSQTAAPSRAAANAPAAAKPPLKVTPQQAVRLAELELAVAKARLLAAERDRDLTKAESDTARLRSELEAMLNGPLDIDAFMNERRRSGRGQRRRTGEAANTATPAPRQNPGRTALDRARRQAERKLAQVDAQQAAAERREAARKRAIAARERRARRTRRALRRAERTLARAAQRQTRATTALEKAQDDLGAFLSQLTVNTDAPAPRQQRSDSRPLNRTVTRSAAPAVTRTVSRSMSAAQASGSRTAATVRPLQTTRRVRRDLAGTKPDPRAIENASPRVKQLVE
ncbi:MAG: extensin family protein, partial [Pseudomonadota bacterium]